MTREMKAMAGTHIALIAGIKGVPFPTVTWKKNDAEVPPRADIETNQTGTKLEMRFCHRGDCGDYTLTVENPVGTKTVTCTVLVLGKYGIICRIGLLTKIQWWFEGTHLELNRLCGF